ncbi:unnamed protein product [Caenorhabditis bovis]|uniref:Uncharacterized protein n=1 Tax=Caenorhabditis bovis TaxID=2654633 RepID=A0A8S1F9X4_9PELO|nr:unnamed protein product [Caenorhabditis bovis]
MGEAGPSSSTSWYDSAGVTTLGSGNLRDALRLPAGEDKNEWLAVNIIDLINQVRMIFGVICESECTDAKCPQMNVKGKVFNWSNNGTILNVSAPQYIDLSLTWCQMQTDDETIFPAEIGKNFPDNFEEICQKMMKRLFRVYAHVYHVHSSRFQEIKALPHLNTSFKQFILFANQFDLLNREEKEPLADVIQNLVSFS